MTGHPARGSVKSSLIRGLTFIPTTCIIVTGVIGSGVFIKARVMTCNVGSPGMVLLVYIIAGIFTLAGALSFAELGAMMPRAGGPYNFVGAAFGRLWAFLTGWAICLAGAIGAAALAAAFAIFFSDLIGGGLSPAQSKAVAVGILVILTALTLAPVRENGIISTVVTILKVALVAGIGLMALFFGDGSWAHFGQTGAAGACEDVPMDARLGAAGFGAAMIGALWSYSGWVFVLMLSEEVRDPGRTLPRALITGTFILIGLYILINTGFFYSLAPELIADVPRTSSVAGVVMVRIIGGAAVSVLAAGFMISTLGALHAAILARSRMFFALSRDGLFPEFLSRVSAKSGAPVYAPLTLGILAILAMWSGTFDILTDVSIIIALLSTGLGIGSVFVLRVKLPEANRPYRAWGYPVMPALFLIGTLYLVINSIIAMPVRTLIGIGLMGSGLLIYFYYARKLPPAKTEDWFVDEGG